MTHEWIGRSGEMELFLCVAEAGSLSEAARRLGLTASGVSRVVTRLEARLGVRLLVRTTRRIGLTPEGEAFLEASRRILKDLDDAEHEAAAGAELSGRLRINTSLPFGSRMIVPLIPEFLERHSGVSVELNLSDTVDDMVTERTDVAIRVGSLPDSALTVRKLFENKRIVTASPDYLRRHGTPRSPHELADHRCLDFSFRRSPGGWKFSVDGKTTSVNVASTVTTNNGETLRQLAVSGLGVARLGKFLVSDDIAAGRLVAILEAYEETDLEPISALYFGGDSTPRRVRAFVEFLVEKLHNPAFV